MAGRTVMMLAAAALLVGGGAIGIASASDRAAADAKAATAASGRAIKALARHGTAIADAEAAVALAPARADYRLLLGQSYIAAGRFASARTAFADALSLAPGNAKAALQLTLAQIATGDWVGARRTLDENGARIAPADHGLALALAGDPEGAVALLSDAARRPDATAKVRQNLALSLALAGKWPAARTVAAVDLSPADVDGRLEQWAALARPHAAADQVSALLGVTPVEDAGQPVGLALNATGPSFAMMAPAATVPVVHVAPAPMVRLAVREPEVEVPGFTKVAFAPQQEVAQPLPMARQAPRLIAARDTIRADRRPAKIALIAGAAAPAPIPQKLAVMPAAVATGPSARGTWYVQLGAYHSQAQAHEAWGKAARRLPALAPRTPAGMSFAARGASVYRLSVGGYARGDADALCRRFRAAGGDCFVRPGAGDQIAAWARKPVQVAAR